MAGERGINLSGGQRQRVCLARAAYHDAELVLLDNPLSAVDQHTSKHIFDKCIKGLLKDKAVVLIAHQLELLPQVWSPLHCTHVQHEPIYNHHWAAKALALIIPKVLADLLQPVIVFVLLNAVQQGGSCQGLCGGLLWPLQCHCHQHAHAC
jgi:hypothetical protein